MGDIYDIQKHPEYRDSFGSPPAVPINILHDVPLEDYADLQVLGEYPIGEYPLEEEPFSLGLSTCWGCTQRKDHRSWWRRLLFSPTDLSYSCTALERKGALDPISGKKRYEEKVMGPLGPLTVLSDNPYRSCLELNSDGECPMFDPGVE